MGKGPAHVGFQNRLKVRVAYLFRDHKSAPLGDSRLLGAGPPHAQSESRGASSRGFEERPAALDLRPVKDAARVGRERVPSMHRTSVVPDQQVANVPGVMPCELLSCRMLPKFVQYCFTFSNVEAQNVLVLTTAQKEGASAGIRMGPHERMSGAGSFSNIVDRLEAFPQRSRAGVCIVVDGLQRLDLRFEIVG